MALKPTRIVPRGADKIDCFMGETAERGIVVVWAGSSTGSLGNLDDPNTTVAIPSVPTGNVPVGVLMNDVVNKDLTQTHLNAHKDEVQVNGKVTILKYGTVQTNMLKTGDSPVPGNPAYYTTDGEFTSSVTSSIQVGRFASAPDADGYVVVEVRL